MPLLFLPLAWIVTAAGRTLAAWLGLPETATRSERNLVGFALGLGLLAYGLLALGLLRLLYPLAGLLLVLALAALGGRQHAAMAREVSAWRPARMAWWGRLAVVLFAAFGLIALMGALSPPTLLEWDSLSYHLAVPKLYLQQHRIFYIPWLLHSNFAFTAEMWYTLGLMAHSVPLAKMFHWACAAGTCLAVSRLGARHLTPRVGVGGALLLASTPVFFWEAGTAYVDVAAAFFVTLTLLAVANGLADCDPGWLRLGAVLMGLALSVKATSFLTLALLALGLLIWRLAGCKQSPWRAFRAVAVWTLTALIVGSPWYLKSLVYTGNPVYPFAHSLFGGRFWSNAATAAYNASNHPGMGHNLSALLLAPWNLTMHLMPGHPTLYRQPFNEFASPLFCVSPLLLAALFFPPFGMRLASPSVKVLAAYALGGLSLWFATTQFVRFLLPLLPVLCLLASWVVCRAVATRSASGRVLAGLAVCSLFWSLLVGGQYASTEAPVVFGQVSQGEYLAMRDPDYDAMRYVNTQLPPDAKLIFYGHPLGFQCDRAYLWSNLYTSYIPTDRFHSAEDLRRWLAAQGVNYLLIDTAYFRPRPDDAGEAGWVYQLTVAHGPPLYPRPGDPERGILIYPLPR